VDDKSWFSAFDVSYEFNIHSATVRKYIRSGELVGTPLLDSEGKEYLVIFLSKNNKDFFSSHFKKTERKQRWNFANEDGEVVWL